MSLRRADVFGLATTGARKPSGFDNFWTDLSDLLREVGVLFDGVAPGRISLDVPPTLSLSADSTKLQQALTNLVSNAIKYSPGGGIVFLSARQEGKRSRSRFAIRGSAFRRRIWDSFSNPSAAAIMLWR
jgi:signal transduction histidine kinase